MASRDLDKVLGCFLGGAIGDALGAPIEFMSLREIRYLFGMEGVRDFVEHPGGIGEFTDDTQMTLFTAEGLIRGFMRFHHKGISSATFVCYNAYLRWLHTQGERVKTKSSIGGIEEDSKWTKDIIGSGWLIKRKELLKRRSPGQTCISALLSGECGRMDRPINDSKGCGGVMRVAPVGLAWSGSLETAFETGCEIAAITHGHPTGYLAAGAFAAIISGLSDGASLLDSIEAAVKILKKEKRHTETLNSINKALLFYKELGPTVGETSRDLPEIIEKLGGGWIAEEALAIALLCSLLYQNDFRRGVLAAVNHSGDSDSTGAIAGNILGLIHGREKLPPRWIDNLKYNDIVIEIAEDFMLNKIDFNSEEGWDRYPGF
ncbi:MAG: ADP-ribosylglycohydrolase family protein [Chloroflexota bacterium]